MFYLSEQHDLAVAQIPKAGLMTMREWLAGFAVVSNQQAMAAPRRIAFIRDPLERLKSGYSMFYWMDVRGAQHSQPAPLDWHEFIDYVLSKEPDEHWRPQSQHVGDTPNELIKFENLPSTLPRKNHWSRVRTDKYREDDLRKHYADDYALRERAV